MHILSVSRIFFLLAMTFSFGGTLLSCTREMQKDAQIAMVVPLKDKAMKIGNTSLTTSGDLNVVVFNIQGPTSALTLCTWHRAKADGRPGYQEGPCDFSQIAQGFLRVQVPSGANQLIQVMFVYESSTNQTTFHYGDAGVSLSPGDNQVPISVVRLAQSSGRNGHVVGQALVNSEVGLTGEMEVRVRPVASRPSMIVERREVYNGWFQSFSLDDVPMEYLVRGQSLLGQPKMLGDLLTLASAVPQAAGVVDAVHSVANATSTDFEVMGYFGEVGSAEKRRVCTTSVCATTEFPSQATEFSNFLVSSSGHFASKFQGPYAHLAGSFDYASLNNGTGVLMWRYLPIPVGQISGSSVFVLQNMAQTDVKPFIVGESQLDCERLSKDPRVTKVADVLYPTATVQIPATLMASQSNVAVICPNVNGRLMKSVISVPRIFEESGGGSSGPYLRFDVDRSFPQGGGSGSFLTQNYCHPVKARLYEGQGASYLGHTAPVIVSGISSGSGTFHSNAACSAALSPTISIAVGSSESTGFYFKPTSPIATQAGVFAATLSDSTIYFDASTNSFAVEAPKMIFDGPMLVTSGACYSARINLRMANGMEYPAPSSLSVSLSGFLGSAYVGSNSSCPGATSSTSATFSPGMFSSTQFYFKIDTTGRALVGSITGFSEFVQDPWSFTVLGSNQMTSMEIVPLSTPVMAGMCQRMMIQFRNQAGAIVPATSTRAIPISIPENRGFIFSDGTCTAKATELNVSEGQYSREFGVLFTINPAAVGEPVTFTTVSGTIGFGTGGNSATNDISVFPNLSPEYLEIQFPDLSGRMILGDHDFITPKMIPVRVPAGRVLACRRLGTTADGSFATGNCTDPGANGAWMVGSYLNWNAAKAVAGDGIEIQYVTPYSQTFSARFQPSQIYGTQFKVLPCTVVYNAAPSFAVLKTHLEAAGNKIACFGSGITLDSTSETPDSLTMVPGASEIKAILGHSSRTSKIILDSNNPTGHTLAVGNLAANSQITIANMILTKRRASAALKIMPTTSNATANILVADTSFGEPALRNFGSGISNTSASANMGNISVIRSEFYLDPTVTPAHISAIELVLIQGNATMEFVSLKVRGTANASSTATVSGIKLSGYGNSGAINIRNLDYTADGLGVAAIGSVPTGTLTNVQVLDSRIEVENPAGDILTKALEFSAASNFIVQNNFLIAGTGLSASTQNYITGFVKMASLDLPVTGQFLNNVLVNRSTHSTGAQYFMNLYSQPGNSAVQLEEFRRNQFVSDAVSLANLSSNPVNLSVPALHTISVGATARAAHGDNVMCTRTNPSGTNWTAFMTGGALAGVSYLIDPSAIFTNCKFGSVGSDVASSGACSRVCP